MQGLDYFGNYKLSINHPNYFFGRKELLEKVVRNPFQVRIILGGRRIGKTSTLNAIRWNLLQQENGENPRVLPVLIDLNLEQPQSLDNFRYILIEKLRETIINPQMETSLLFDLRNLYRRFLGQIDGANISFFNSIEFNVTNPHRERALIENDFYSDLVSAINALNQKNCQGICFLLDGAEYIVGKSWDHDVWSYLRSLKDGNDSAVRSSLGLILTGYRELRDYHQKKGSPLANIADKDWLGPLNDQEVQKLVEWRCQVSNCDSSDVIVRKVQKLGGGHPFLTNQIISACLGNINLGLSPQELENRLINELRESFQVWWEERFQELDRRIYLALQEEQQISADNLANRLTDLAPEPINDALEILCSSGVVCQAGDTYRIGAALFSQWVQKNQPPLSLFGLE